MVPGDAASSPVAVRQGEIHWVDWSPGRGSEQAGRRPALIVQVDAANLSATYPNTVVATISSVGRELFTHVALDPTEQNGLKQRSYVKCEQLLTISKSRLAGRLGRITEDEMARVAQAIRYVFGL